MAEAITALALGASILAFVDVAGKATERLKDFYHSSRDVPKDFRNISDRLPLLLEKVAEIKACCDIGLIDEKRAKVLRGPLDGCKRQVDTLDNILTRCLPLEENTPGSKKDSRFRLTLKALKSIPKEKDIQKLQQTLLEYESTLVFYFSDIRISRENTAQLLEGSASSTRYYEVPGWAVYKFVGRKGLLDTISRSFSQQRSADSRAQVSVLKGLGGKLILQYMTFLNDAKQAKVKRN